MSHFAFSATGKEIFGKDQSLNGIFEETAKGPEKKTNIVPVNIQLIWLIMWVDHRDDDKAD